MFGQKRVFAELCLHRRKFVISYNDSESIRDYDLMFLKNLFFDKLRHAYMITALDFPSFEPKAGILSTL